MNAPPPLPGMFISSAIIAATVAFLAFWFVRRYSRVPWDTTPEGRHLMRFSIVVGITYGLTAALIGFGLFVVTAPFWMLVAISLAQLFLFGWAALEMYARNVLFTEAQRHDPTPAPGE